MKKSMKYICMFLMLLGIHVNAWGTTESMDFSSSTWAWPQGYNAYETTHTKGAHQVIVKYAQKQTTVGVILNSKSSDAYMLLPAFPGTVSSITIATCSGSASNQVINLYDNSTNDLLATTTIATGGGSFTFTTGVNSYNLPYSGVSSGTIIRIEGDGVNVQLSSISVTHNGSAMPTIDVDDYVLNMSTTTIRGTLEDGEITAEVPFSVTINNVDDGWPIVYFALENISPAGDLTLYSMSNIDGSGWWDDPDPDGWNMYMYSDYEDPWVSYTERFSFTYYCVEAGTYTAKFRLYDEDINVLAEASLTFVITEPCTDRSITMSNFSKDFGSADFVPTHTVSAGSGTKTWTSSNTDVATIVDGKVHIVASGTSTIGLTVAEADPYCEVSQSCTMTVNALVPTVTAFTGTSSSTTSITLTNAQVSNKGGAAISAYGYIYSTTASTAETLKIGETGVSTATVASADIAASTNFASKTVSGLTTGTTYYVRAYATNSAGTGYSAVQSVKTIEYTDYTFSCAELTLTPKLVTASTPIFVTSSYSATNKTVRSQDSILVHGSGLTPNAQVVFTAGSKFEVKSYKYDTIRVAADGTIDRYVYIFYTPSGSETEDGLDQLTGITASVSGAKPKTTTLTQDIIGRHLPAEFVIAGKKDGRWYALPNNMATGNTPDPSEIAVDDIDNPSIAYVADTTIYGLAGPTATNNSGGNGQYIRLTMSKLTDGTGAAGPAPLYASTSANIGKNGTASATSDLSAGWWWALTQKNTSITNASDAKYRLTSPNNGNTLSIKNSPFVWGLYASGVEELRIIPASESTVVFAAASVVAWGKNGAIIEAEKPYDVNAYSFIVAKLPGGTKSDTIALVQTGTSVKGTGTRYNFTVNFGVGVDFSANEGKMLTLEWFNSSKVLKAVSNVTVPRIVASNTTINSANYTNKSVWNTEVHVLPGDTLTIDASGYSPNKDVTIKELNIYPGATVKVLNDTLKVTNLVLRNGWNRIGLAKAEYDVARLYIKPGTGCGSVKATNAYLDWYIDYDQYYPIAVPWKVATSAITYKNMVVDIDQGLIVRYYDGERHAKGGDGDTNWKQYSWATDMPANLIPGIGYAITARRPAGKAFSIIRMPLTIPSTAWTINGEQGEVSSVHKDQVAVTAWVKDEGETPDHAKGWNFIANPYMSMYQGEISHSEGDAYDIAYVNIPDVNFKEFDQVATDKAKLKPGSGFLIQTEETGTLTFGASNRKVNAPSYLTETPKASKQKAYIILSGEEAEDEMGLIISERYTAEYEINADLEKILSDGNTLRTFMRYGDLNMAYVAINEELAKEWIPVTVRIPESGEYTYSLHEASKVSEMEGIYLIDYSNGQVTNLIEDKYTFVSDGGTIADRFAINAIVGKHDIPTDIDIINAGGDIHSDKPVKFVWNDNVFILHRGVIYDSTGKRVKGGAQ